MAEGQLSMPLDLTRSGIIEASAGTGKTFTIAEIYLALLRGEKRLSPQDSETLSGQKNFSPISVRNILVVTFTDAATAELRARLRIKIREALAKNNFQNTKVQTALRLADAEFDEAAVFTIHGFCLRILKEFGLSSRLEEVRDSLFEELSRFATRWRIRKIIEGKTFFFDIDVEEILSILNPLLQNPDIVPIKPPDNDSRGNALFQIATEAFSEWTEQRQSARDIAYGEILIELRDSLRRDPRLAEKIAQRFSIAIVDEFQDTDPVQWEIFKRIFLANDRPIFCVGDPKQAIYEFRGGDIRTYRNAREKILSVGQQNMMTLGENWRSAPETIAALNELFSADKNTSGTFNIGTYKKQQYIATNLPGVLEYSPVAFPSKKKKIASVSSSTPAAVLKITEATSNKNSAKKNIVKNIVRDIVDLIKTRGIPAQDLAILVSDNEEANTYRTALTNAKIPVSTTARGNVLCTPIAQATADILRAMLEPQSTTTFRRALLSPFFAGVGEKLLFSDETSSETESARRAFSEAHDRWIHKGFLPAFHSLSEKLGFFRNISTLPAAKTLVTNSLHLTEILHATERRSRLSPRTLTETFEMMIASANPLDDLEATHLRADTDQAAVRILTVHKSKGLEFEIVFIPSLWAQTLQPRTCPNFTKGSDEKNTTVFIFDTSKKDEKSDKFLRAMLETSGENSACRFYVALTRARSRIVVYHVPQVEKNTPWNSYQKQIFETAGAFSEDSEKKLPHWKILAADDPLPETVFPNKSTKHALIQKKAPESILSQEDANRRFENAERILKKLSQKTEGVFSFSRIIRAKESDDTLYREDDENDNVLPELASEEKESRNDAEILFQKQAFSDLPAGKEFGTLAHLIFEKIDFRSLKNLSPLLESALPRLPKWTSLSKKEQATLKEKFAAMVDENLMCPLTNRQFRLKDLDEKKLIREMEFHFPLKQSHDLYTKLAQLFKSWGGIYAETANRHWTKNTESTSLSFSIGGMMTGVLDLAFQENGQYFILDWKTNALATLDVSADFKLPQSAIREEIIKHGYALQWTIYALALRNFLKQSLGDTYNHDRDFGGVIYLFLRWKAPFIDTQTLTSDRLSAFENLLI